MGQGANQLRDEPPNREFETSKPARWAACLLELPVERRGNQGGTVLNVPIMIDLSLLQVPHDRDSQQREG
jgi:hypothetical protein